MSRGGGVTIRGDWPGSVVLRSGWAKAHARPWNDADRSASLRFERGSADFLHACAQALFALDVPAVYSAPVHRSGQGIWERAGFEPDRQLILMERSLPRHYPSDLPSVDKATVDDVAAIDSLAFEPDWQIGRLGLVDALGATVQAEILSVGDGFALVGVSGPVAYLQRLAVHPAAQGKGVGKTLVWIAMRWARSSGARSIMLNTQPDNHRATALYRSMGFEVAAERLTVLRITKPSPRRA